MWPSALRLLILLGAAYAGSGAGRKLQNKASLSRAAPPPPFWLVKSPPPPFWWRPPPARQPLIAARRTPSPRRSPPPPRRQPAASSPRLAALKVAPPGGWSKPPPGTAVRPKPPTGTGVWAKKKPPPGGTFTGSGNLTAMSAYELQRTPSMIVGVHLMLVPNTDWFLLMERPSGFHPDNSRSIAGLYHIRTQQWIHIESPDGLFCAGHTVLADGRVLVAGGHQANAGWPSGMRSIRVLDIGLKRLIKVADMKYERWYPSPTLMPDGRVVIMGGTQGVGAGKPPNPYYEVWDPAKPTETQLLPVNDGYLKSVKQNYYPFNYVLPTGDMFNFCGRSGWIMEPLSNKYIAPLPRRLGYPNSQFPFTATSVMLMLEPDKYDREVEVVIFGGANEEAVREAIPTKVAAASSHRLRVRLPQAPNETYIYPDGGWVEEAMRYPRVMGDATLLPNGHVVLLNGAQQGLAGDSASGGESRANFPTLFAQIYNPYKNKGSRYRTMAQSRIARMYHSTAALTIDGTVLVSGCDRCWKMKSDMDYDPPRVKAEYRQEIFYPPFWYQTDLKPTILEAPDVIGYGGAFNILYGSESGNPDQMVTGAVLVAPSSTTHSFNMNQRAVGLKLMNLNTMMKAVRFYTPPNANIAPAQYYMLFLLNGDVYSRGRWILLDRRTVLERAARGL